MKRLALFRHAKTERDSESGRDFDRRLTERGRSDAVRTGEEVRGQAFDLILSSPAARAAETAELAGLQPRFDQRIYNASAGELLAMVQGCDDSLSSVMLIGHNPGFEQLASRLIGQQVEMPTGSVAQMELPIESWRGTGQGAARLVRFLQPKELD